VIAEPTAITLDDLHEEASPDARPGSSADKPLLAHVAVGRTAATAWPGGAAETVEQAVPLGGRVPGTLSLSGVVGTLQILLATRRAARIAAYAHWSSLARDA
jgi:hypothetical protein